MSYGVTCWDCYTTLEEVRMDARLRQAFKQEFGCTCIIDVLRIPMGDLVRNRTINGLWKEYMELGDLIMQYHQMRRIKYK